MDIPGDRKYSREHEWVLVEGGACTIGITDYAQSELGDIVFVELPEVGAEIAVQDAAGTIEAVKTVADMYAPVSGEIIEVNEMIEDDPERVNRDPYGEGWMFKVTLADPVDLDGLMDAHEYKKLVEELMSQA